MKNLDSIYNQSQLQVISTQISQPSHPNHVWVSKYATDYLAGWLNSTVITMLNDIKICANLPP